LRARRAGFLALKEADPLHQLRPVVLHVADLGANLPVMYVATPVWKATRSIALKKPGSREDDFLLMVRRLARQKIRGKPRGEAAT
jgi:hypothetical protein